MSVSAAPRQDAATLRRFVAPAAGLALALAAALLAHRLAPGASVAPGALAALILAAVAGLMASLEAAGLASLAISLGLAAVVLFGADLSPAGPDVMGSAFGLGALGGAAAVGAGLLAARRRKRRTWMGPALVGIAAVGAIGAYAAIYVARSRDLMLADFIYYREAAIAVASLADAGRWRDLAVAFLALMTNDYSWAPALAPGLTMAASAPLSRLAYETPIIVLYGAPALVALALLARDLALRAGLPRERATGAALALAAGAAFAAYPTGVVVLARGMPDIGGLVFYAAALQLGERLLRLAALPPGHDTKVRPLVRRVTAALALCVFAMVLFRRWYAFAALGLALTLIFECALIALRRRAAFRWRDAAMAACYGLLLLLAFASPAIVAWLPDPAAHDYTALYAAYRKPFSDFVAELAAWCGWAVPLAAAAGATMLYARSANRRLLRLTIGAAAIAAAMLLRVQTPYVHHLYLVTPALTALIGAPLLIVFGRRPRFAALALAALAMTTLTPYVARFAPAGFAPSAALAPAPRADLAELARMKAWVEARARPDNRVCGLGSSYRFSGQLIEELWQLDPVRSPIYANDEARPSVTMADVDSVQGAPNPQIKTCAIILVGDPVQTHLDPDYQLDVILPAREMLEGRGIGAHYRRSGEVFHLEDGVAAIVFERSSPLDDADMTALTDRWREARARVELRGPISP